MYRDHRHLWSLNQHPHRGIKDMTTPPLYLVQDRYGHPLKVGDKVTLFARVTSVTDDRCVVMLETEHGRPVETDILTVCAIDLKKV